LIPTLILGGLCAMFFGILFGLPSLRVKGLYLAVATLAAQFFSDWMFLRIQWLTNDSPSGSVSVTKLKVLGLALDTPMARYLFCLSLLAVIALLTKNLVRGAIGREWMAIRDMDVAAAVIGIRPMYAKLSAFAVSSFIIGVAGALWAFVHLGSWEPAAFNVELSFRLLFMVIIGGMGSIMGSVLWRWLHRHTAHCAQSVFCRHWAQRWAFEHVHRDGVARRAHDFRRPHRLVPHCRAPWPGKAVVHGQAKAAASGRSHIDTRHCRKPLTRNSGYRQP
jgi:hypothetical protein